MKNWYRIEAKGQTGEILIYDAIGIDPWTGEGVGAKQFVQDMRALDKTDEINVRINSPGGSVFDGAAIQTALVQAKQTVNVFIDGIAASAASFIAMAGDTITIPENALMMIHNASGLTWGDYRAHEETIRALKVVGDAMRNTYHKRTGIDNDTLQQMLDDTTWMDGREAVRLGFADNLTEPVRMAAFAGASQKLQSLHEAVPDWVQEKLASVEVDKRPQDRGSQPSNFARLHAMRMSM